MRKPGPIRVWNWLAAAGLLFCLASFAAAQKTPKVWKDPATGHTTTQAQKLFARMAPQFYPSSHRWRAIGFDERLVGRRGCFPAATRSSLTGSRREAMLRNVHASTHFRYAFRSPFLSP